MVVTIHLFVAISLPVLKDMAVMAICLCCSELLGVYLYFFSWAKHSTATTETKTFQTAMFSLLAPKQKLIARSYKWQEKKTQNLCSLFAARNPQRCAGHAVISSEIHANFNKTGQLSPTQVCRQALQKHWMEMCKELILVLSTPGSTLMHSYVNGLNGENGTYPATMAVG